MGPRPGAELLARTGEDGDLGPAGLALEESGDGLLGASRRDEVAQASGHGEHAHRQAVVLGHVALVESSLGEPDSLEREIVERKILDARLADDPGQRGLPDRLGQPHSPGHDPEDALDEVLVCPDLRNPVPFGEDRENGCVDRPGQ